MDNKIGRPSLYNDMVVDKLCRLIATSNKGLHHICKNNPDLPEYKTIFNWLNDPDKKDFLHKYVRAREEQAEYLADEIIEIADDSSRDTIVTDDGREIFNQEFAQRSRIRIDARKWIASKLKPKKFGDKMILSGDKDNPITVENISKISDEDLKILDELATRIFKTTDTTPGDNKG